MAQSTMQSILSSDGSLAAVVSPASSSRLMIQVYQVAASSCSLQLTLTHSTSNPLKDLVFCGNSMVVGLMGTSEVVIWDLDRGVIVNKMMASSEDQNFLALAGDSKGTHYSILTQHSQKLYVYDYMAATNKLTRKIKSGRFEGDSEDVFLAASEKHVVVQTSAGARVMDRESGSKVGKIKSKKLSRIFICPNDSNILVGVQNSGAVALFNLSTTKKVVSVPQALSSSACALQLVRNEDSSHTLLADQTLYNIDGSSAEKVAQLTSTQPTAIFLTQEKLLALIRQKTGGCRAEWVDLADADLPASINLGQVKKAEAEKKESAKRKSSETMILGPGQAGTEVAPPTKKPKSSNEADDENETEEKAANEISIAERLQQLSNVLDEDDEEDDDEAEPNSNFKPKQATTESLKELLSQALQSGDDSLLELALGVSDVQIISTTLKEIEPSLILVLVSKLTTRLASTPMRAEQLAKWLSYCLKTGKFQPHHLSSLRNLLFERIESFSDLLRLEGRLSMMCDVE
jgi:U3 small nucleolar RNA-associated protein 5